MVFVKIFFVLAFLIAGGILSWRYDMLIWGVLCALLFFLGYVVRKSKSMLIVSLVAGAFIAFVMDFMSLGLADLGRRVLLATPLFLGMSPGGFCVLVAFSWLFIGLFYVLYAPSLLKENRPRVFKALWFSFGVLLMFSVLGWVVLGALSGNLEKIILTDFYPPMNVAQTPLPFCVALCLGWGLDLMLKYVFVRRYFQHKIPVFPTVYICQIKTFLLITIPWFLWVVFSFYV